MKSKTLKEQRPLRILCLSLRHLLGNFAYFVAIGHHVFIGSDGCGDQQSCSTGDQRLDSGGFSKFLVSHQSCRCPRARLFSASITHLKE